VDRAYNFSIFVKEILLNVSKKTISKFNIRDIHISSTSVAILLTIIICLFLTIKFSWTGVDGKGYTRIIDSDGKGYYMYLPNIFLNKSIREQTVDNRYILEISGKGVNKYYVGTAIAMLPFFGLGYMIAYFQGDELDGYSPPFQKAISLAGLFYFILGLIFLGSFLLLYEIKKNIIAFILIIISFGTNLLTYSVISPSMSHIYSWCFITAFLYFTKKIIVNQKIKYFYLSIILLGFIILIRPTNGIIILIVPFLSVSFSNFKKALTFIYSLKNIVVSGIILLAIFFLQSYLWYIQTGSFFIQGYKNEGFYFLSPQIWNVLFSFRKGLFIYTPLVFLSLFGLLFVKKNRFEFFSLCFFLISLIYIISSWWNWYYGPSFGQRPFIEYYGIVGLLLALLFSQLRTKFFKILLFILSLIFVYLNLIQNYQYHSNIISAWDMTFGKYQYTFLNTSPKFIGCLGGNDDIIPYKAQKKLCFTSVNDFESISPNSKTNFITFDSISKSHTCNYENREFNWSVKIPIDSLFITSRSLYAEVNIDRLEKVENNLKSALFVIHLSDTNNVTTYYYCFKIDDYPTFDTNIWNTFHYNIEIPRIISQNGSFRMYIWNKEKTPFLIDNIEINVFAIF
jgi:hypothetical protein